MNRNIGLVGVALLLVTVGCSAKRPPPELVDARAAQARAQVGPALQTNPAGLKAARQALDEAERKFQDDPGSDETRHLAYLAHRKALLAESQARTTIAQSQQVQARSALAQLRRAQLNREGKLDVEQKKAKELQETWQGLTAFCAVKDEARGKVLSLPSGVLFGSNNAELMPTAKERLDEVAKALGAYSGRHIVIVGHTDNVGTHESNKELSQKRAEAVRDYLAAHGVKPDLIRAEGHGEAEPIASNDSPEDRANNRRVEIIVEQR